MSTQLFTETLVIEHCYKCGIAFGLEAAYQRERIAKRDDFHCPNGHAQHYLGKSEAQQAREVAEQARRDAEWQKQLADSWKESAERAQRSAAATRGVVTRIKRRVGNGVCPCCNRTFKDLAAHMAGQHPAWKETE